MGLYGTENSVMQVRENPAFAWHEDRAQINFGGIGYEVGGNSILYKRSIYGYMFNGTAAMDKDYFRNHNDQPSKNFWGQIEMMGPGASLRYHKKYFFSINTGMRYLVNSNNMSDEVFSLMGVNPRRDTNTSDSFTIKDYSLTAQVFSELSLSYSGFIYESEDYKLLGGVSLKFMNGIAAAGMGIPDANFKTYKNDGYAYNTNAIVNVAFTPNANRWAITPDPFRATTVATNNISMATDLGLVFYMNPNESFEIKHGYVNRFSVSITDIGRINYTGSSTTGSYQFTNSKVHYRGINNSVDTTFGNRIFNNYLIDSIATVRGSSSKFKVGLPTALRMNADMRVHPRVFVNGNVIINLRSPSSEKYSNHYVTTVTVAPRYMIHNFSVGMPFSFNAEKQGYLGAIVTYRSFYLGSGSLFQTAVSNSINNLNLYFGANMRIKQKKQKEKDMMMM